MRRALALCALLLVGCDPDDEAPDPGGSSGQGGSAGSGASGKGGNAGQGGASGKGGNAGQGGNAGSAGGQGGAGQGGSSAGGQGGSAGNAGSGGSGGSSGAGGSAGASGSRAEQGGSAAGGSAAGGAGQSGGGQGGGAGQGGAGSGGAGQGGAGSGGGGQGGEAGAGGVSVVGRQLRVGGAPFHLKGVCWNPVAKGKTHPDGLDFAGDAAVSVPLMVQAGINTVRTYEPLTDKAVLDLLYANGIRVLNSVYPYGGAPVSVVTERVNAAKDHPAVLMWLLGNEWNYNGLYVGLSFDDSLKRINEAAALVKAADPSRPIATIYGELPTQATIEAMPLIDLWGLNVYRGIGFGGLFDDWAKLSQKPMFLGEYGADAFNAKLPGEDQGSQAEATEKLTLEINAHASAKDPAAVCAGGTLFSWIDEWWKAGNPDAHDNGGSAPGGGPYPDQTFNEEWWGIVDIDHKPRKAYDAYKKALQQAP